MDSEYEGRSEEARRRDGVVSLSDRLQLMIEQQILEHPDDFAAIYIELDNFISYDSFCNDFGPVGIGNIYDFCNFMETENLQNSDSILTILTVPNERRKITNAAFLAGAYMIICLDKNPHQVELMFLNVRAKFLSFRDVSPGPQNFHLDILECWKSLWRAKSLGWVDFSQDGFDPDEYAHFDSPLEADLHEIVPGRFVAMRGPVALPKGMHHIDVLSKSGHFSHRDFSVSHYVDILKQFEVCFILYLQS